MNIVDSITFKSMIENGCRALKSRYETINDLNVFPVPDGDTGTNMTATLTSGVASMNKVEVNHLGKTAQALAKGMLLGARGNSGVILSQFFAGVSAALEGLEVANVEQFSAALVSGTNRAYTAVVKPVEGTILTVANVGTRYIASHIGEIETFEELFKTLLDQMRIALSHTPELLPVLKEAGVIDSGGAGLVAVIEGMCKKILGEEIEDTIFNGPVSSIDATEEIPFDENSELEYGYCTEFILQLLNSKNGPEKFDLDEAIAFLEKIGDSIVAVRDGTIVKIHVHTKTPYIAMEYAQKFGEFITFKMENMSIQHNEVLLKEMPIESEQENAIICVASSDGLAELFTNMGCSYIIKGGQTMNPSAEDFIKGFKEVHAKNIIVFPNNGNVILTAKQAAEMYPKANIVVIESKSMIDAYVALPMIDFAMNDMETNIQVINETMSNVISASISTAVRDSKNNGLEIKQGNYLGICGGEVRSTSDSLIECTKRLFESIDDIEDRSLITVFYGQDVTEEDKENFRNFVSSEYRLMDLEEIVSNQSIYQLLFAIE
ncbi:MAG: DAK2 domain-containing protein [Bacilli bacterium]|nr:DAK2 domain-containing protein [Bacilli bacterium]MDY6430670.1 DAK2 domain-containing protein [Bacilli bacterium]